MTTTLTNKADHQNRALRRSGVALHGVARTARGDAPIKPCPFCGGKQVEIARTNENACWVECARYSCGARTKSHATRAGGIANWNRRRNQEGTARIVYDMEKQS